MGSITRSLSRLISSARTWIQASAVFLSNLFLLNLPEGRIYQGNLKKFCVPGLNCYSCPAASGACPVGALQAVSGSSKFTISFYVTGFLMMLGVLFGRFVCGFLCPFGWFQELLHKIPSRKFSTKKMKPLRYLKYAVLLIANSSIRAALGSLFTWKACILAAVIVSSVLFYRPFCKWLCPLGAFYALFNRISLLNMQVDKDTCISCRKCADVCGMDVDITKTSGHSECIRCGVCIKNCPVDAISFTCSSGIKKR